MIEIICLVASTGALISPPMNETSLVVNVTPSTDWNLIWVTLFLGVCALLAPPISKWVEHNMYAPKLEFSFRLASPYCHRTR